MKEFGELINFLSSVIGFALKISVMLGGGLLIFYSMHIGYPPSGITVGDLFYFILAAVGFGFSSVILAVLFATAGSLLVIMVIIGLRAALIAPALLRFRKVNSNLMDAIKIRYEINKIGVFGGIFGVIGIVLSYILTKSWLSAIEIISIGGLMSMSFRAVMANSKKNRSTLIMVSEERSNSIKKEKIVAEIIIFAISAILFLINPASRAVFLDAGMSFSMFRKNKVDILLAEPYGKILGCGSEKEKITVNGRVYGEFGSVDILSMGFGSDAVIQCYRNGERFTMELPRSDLILLPMKRN
jgi:hypothetical protein